MSKPKPARRERQQARGETARSEEQATPAWQAAELRPRRGMFIVLMILLAIWAGFLLALYLMTVMPQRKRPALPATAPQAMAVPEAGHWRG